MNFDSIFQTLKTNSCGYRCLRLAVLVGFEEEGYGFDLWHSRGTEDIGLASELGGQVASIVDG